MARTLKVTGIGCVTLPPDQCEISLHLHATEPDYASAMETVSQRLSALQDALSQLSFARDMLKTADFRVSTEYESIRDEVGNYKEVFVGYCCSHRLLLRFPYDPTRLTDVLSVIAACVAAPELNVAFTVKDAEAVRAALLEDAAQNARCKAEILAKASGVQLGELLHIDYRWAETELRSTTGFGMDASCLVLRKNESLHLTPDDITVRDEAAFLWELV